MTTSLGAAIPWRDPRRRIAQPLLDGVDARFVRLTLVLFLGHAALGFAIRASTVVASAHALATTALALLAVANIKSPSRILPLLGYVVASEALWRLGHAAVFYELAKYLLAAISTLSVLRLRRHDKASMMPLVYFLLLVPSILIMPYFDREDVSFNLSGPFSLAMATYFFSHRPISPGTLRKILTATMAPIVSLVFIAAFSTLTTEDINFFSTKVTSGGLGPNQASSLLGMGGLIAFLYHSLLRRHRLLSWTFGILGVWCSAQAALTFSRGGVVTAAGAIAAASFFLVMDRRFRGAVAIRVILVLVLVTLFVFPVLDDFTDGDLSRRFSSTHLTGRDRIIRGDVIAFEENPIFGVGPGQSKSYHALTFRRSSSHTEYSRLIAEHGLLGVTSLLLLLAMCLRWLRQPVSFRSKALSAAMVAWSLLYMFHAAMRMALVSFAFALASVILIEPQTPLRREHRPVRRTASPRAPRPLPPTS